MEMNLALYQNWISWEDMGTLTFRPSPRPTTADNCHTASIPIHNSLGSEHDAHFMIAIYFYHVAAEYIRIK